MLSDRNQIQKTINCDSIYMKFLEKKKLWVIDRKRYVVAWS